MYFQILFIIFSKAKNINLKKPRNYKIFTIKTKLKSAKFSLKKKKMRPETELLSYVINGILFFKIPFLMFTSLQSKQIFECQKNKTKKIFHPLMCFLSYRKKNCNRRPKNKLLLHVFLVNVLVNLHSSTQKTKRNNGSFK